MRVIGFYGFPLAHLNHKPWRLRTIPKESVRGTIRGAAARESLLFPSPAKATQRKIRQRLVTAYIRRFGVDEFSEQFSVARFPPQIQSNWLPGGYGHWRDRNGA